ncbi:MAG TPA: tetratricopeptide repeat protein [Anaerolineales bacterium]
MTAAPPANPSPSLKTRIRKLFAPRGGDTISAHVGEGGRGVAVGKNIVQIGTLVIPTLPVLALLGLVVAGLVYLALGSLGPEQMTGSFNIAVADFGQAAAQGDGSASAKGSLLSRLLFEGLKLELDALPTNIRQDFRPQVWQDSLGRSEMRRKIGVIPGATPQARQQAACALAGRIHAHVVIYGNLPPAGDPAEFVPEYAICDNPGLRIDADEIVGSHQPGAGIPGALLASLTDANVGISVNIRMNAWIQALSSFSIGIMYDLQGRPDLALPVFQKARDQMGATPGPGAEVVWFFIGRENLWLKRLDEAQAAFEQALSLNPGYARAHIGLGSVAYDRAQDLPPAGRLKTPDLQNALDQYQAALDSAAGSPGALIEPKARLGLGTTLLLQGEAEREAGDMRAAADAFDRAAAGLGSIMPALDEAKQYRLMAQTYQALGNAYFQQGQLRQVQGDPAAGKALYQKASQAYGECIQQGQADPADAILAEQIIAALCVPYQKAADQAAGG